MNINFPSNDLYPLIYSIYDKEMDHTIKPPILMTAKIHGVLPGHIWRKGDIISSVLLYFSGNYIVEEVIEQCDSAGIYENPNHKINSQFRIKVTRHELP